MFYDMEQFMVQCVETYLAAASKTRDSLKCAALPFLDEDRLVESADGINTGSTAYRFQRSHESILWSKNGQIRSAEGSGQPCKERHKMERKLR